MHKLVLVLALAVAMAGCADSSTNDPGSSNSSTESKPATGGNQTMDVQETILVDMDWQYTNGLPPGPFANDVTVTEFTVMENFSRISTDFTVNSAPIEVFATNCRIWSPSDMDQNAFNGNSCSAELPGETGTWRLSYFVEHT
ncbi:MAG: hypothetical protein ACPHK8_04740, partial [Thermoplasmatota archaeon]